MCKCLKISRSLVYYLPKTKKLDSKLENEIIMIFENSRNNYGARKIKVVLNKTGYNVSRKRIRNIMLKFGLISKYTIKNFRNYKARYNEEEIDNIVDRNFDQGIQNNVVVSDLTYVNVKSKWNYICILLDLYNREIIGYSAGKNKDAQLVYRAFAKIKESLNGINIFHTDRGSEFKNETIDNLLQAFNINRSLSKKGCPYDNAVAEANFKIIKTELIMGKKFNSTEELERELSDYVNWYNNHRIHGTLNYLTPIEYKEKMSE